MKSTLRVLILLLVTIYYSLNISLAQSNQSELQKAHYLLFDSLLPKDTKIEKERAKWRDETFSYLSDSKDMSNAVHFLISQGLLDKAKNTDTFEFLLQLQRSENSQVAKIASLTRKFYGYISYSAPFINKIANIIEPKVDLEAPCKKAVPQSKLKLSDNTIQHTEGEIDYLIIGSGPAGSVLAHELVRRLKANVVLVETGPLIDPDTVLTEYQSPLMESNNRRISDDGAIHIRNGAVIGGGSTINVNLAFSPLLPNVQNKLKSWIEDKKLPSNFVHKEGNDFKVIANAYQWVVDKLKTRSVQTYEINRNNMLLMTGIATGRAYDLNIKSLSRCDLDNHLSKISAVETFIWPALNDKKFLGNLSIIPNTKAVKIIHNGSKATEVELQAMPEVQYPCSITDPSRLGLNAGQKVKIKPKRIIVSAGSLGSSELLLRSNIPNKNVGLGLIMHPSLGMGAYFKDKIKILDGIDASVYANSIDPKDDYYFESMGASPAFMASLNPGRGEDLIAGVKEYDYFGGFGIMLIDTVDNNNKVYIEPKTELVQVHYKLTDDDKKRMKKGLIEGVKVLFKQGAKSVFIPSSEDIYSSKSQLYFKSFSEAEEAIKKLEFKPNQTSLTSAHMQASNKMGSDPSNSVVSTNLKVWNQQTKKEFENLFVVDSSIFPTSIGANPMQSIYTLAKLYSDKLIGAEEIDQGCLQN